LATLDQRRAKRAAEGGAVLHADEQRRLRGIRHLGGRDPQAVLAQQSGEVLQALAHLEHGSVACMWTRVLVAGAVLDRGRPALDAVQAQSISAAVRFLSDDLLEGRGTGTRGHAIAEQYVATRMQALGLRPAGETGYLQRVKLCETRAQGRLIVDGAEVKEVQVVGDCAAPERTLEGELAFAGYGQAGELPELRGKIAMVLAGAPASLPSTQRALASSNEDKLKRLRAAGAIAE